MSNVCSSCEYKKECEIASECDSIEICVIKEIVKIILNKNKNKNKINKNNNDILTEQKRVYNSGRY